MILSIPCENYVRKFIGGIEITDFDFDINKEPKKFELDEKKEEYINTHIQELKETYNYLTGPINLFLTNEETNDELIDLFNELKANGKIISKKEFTDEYIKENGYYNKSSDNLGRIFGAQFINETKSKFKAPDFIIVVEDKSNIKCKIYWGNMPAIILLNAKIYFKEIKGKPNVKAHRHDLSKIGYIDVAGDDGNLIETDNGELFIVDTEPKSFTDYSFLRQILFNKPKIHNEFIKNNITYINERRAKLYEYMDIFTISI